MSDVDYVRIHEINLLSGGVQELGMSINYWGMRGRIAMNLKARGLGTILPAAPVFNGPHDRFVTTNEGKAYLLRLKLEESLDE